jgi:very-short-patch-repair endonuclease
MTPSEVRLWSALRAQKINFRRQTPIGPYIADFAHHDARIIVELDGGQHAEDDGLAADAARTAWLEGRGYRVLRFWNPEVQENLEGVVETILAAVAPPPRPSPVKGEGEEL